MTLLLQFQSLKDWSCQDKAVAFMDLLDAFDLQIEKVGRDEPLRKAFNRDDLNDYWMGEGMPGQSLTCHFLFKGKGRFGFSGMLVWARNLPASAARFNLLFIEVKTKPRPPKEFLLALGDQLFAWADATYGFIGHGSLYKPLDIPPERRLYVPEVFWANYFGQPYVALPDFAPDLPTQQVGPGVRYTIADDYQDPRVTDPHFLRLHKEAIGAGWFADGPVQERRLPHFDFSALRRPSP